MRYVATEGKEQSKNVQTNKGKGEKAALFNLNLVLTLTSTATLNKKIAGNSLTSSSLNAALYHTEEAKRGPI
jgi:hypothetical protein